MRDYSGKVCPYCKTPFEAYEEDIVLCSQCEMPHHKSCWIENQGCTTFGCLGTMKNADGSPTSVTATQMNFDAPGAAVFCTQCGARNAEGTAFCTQCGRPLAAPAPQTVYTPPAYQAPVYQQPAYQAPVYQPPQPTYQPPQPTYQPPQPTYQPPQPTYQAPTDQPPQQPTYQAGGYQPQFPSQPSFQQTGNGLDEDLNQLIGQNNQDYYVSKFLEMKSQNKKATWNWPAFLFSGYWLLYRKMYIYGIGVILGALLLSEIPLVLLAGYIVMGIFGNALYMNHLETKAKDMKTMDPMGKRLYAEKNGGVNSVAVIIALVIVTLISLGSL